MLFPERYGYKKTTMLKKDEMPDRLRTRIWNVIYTNVFFKIGDPEVQFINDIELDGGQHFKNKEDETRDELFKQKGYETLRFWNNGVLTNIEGVLRAIQDSLSPSLNPSRQGREKVGHG